MKRYTFITMAVIMAALACLPLQAVNTITYTATYDNSALTLGTDTLGGITYSTVTLDGLHNGGAPGTPSLPVDYIRFSVPWNATNFTVSTTPISGTIMPLGHQLYPNQTPRLMSDTSAVVITPPDSSAYQDNIFFPANRAWVVDEGFLAGENHIVTVAVMPMAYRHRLTSYMDQHQYRLSRNVTITLSYELSDTLAMYPIVRQNTTLRSEGYRLAQSMVVNPENVTTHAPTGLSPDTVIVVNLDPTGTGEGLRYETTGVYHDTIPVNLEVAQMADHSYPYLIVTTPELKHAVRRIAALKNQKGLRTKVVTIDEVLNNPLARYGDLIKQPDGTYVVANGNDKGKLRQFLKFCYGFYGTKYVLLAGTDLPYQHLHGVGYDYLTDLYFSDLSPNWASFSNINRFPEVYVGRLLAKDPVQIGNYTNKLLRYELNPGRGNGAYLVNAFFSEGKDFNGSLQNVKVALSEMFSNHIILNEQSDIVFPNGKDFIDSINSSNVGFLFTFNHGDTTKIRVYGNNNQNMHFVQSMSNGIEGNGLNDMQNKYSPMIYYAPACKTMPFDNKLGLNYGESFTTGKDYGGPVYIGYTRSIQLDYVKDLVEQFANIIKNGLYTLGEAYAFSKIEASIDSYDAMLNLGYLGDASLKVWTDMPQHFTGIGISRTDNSVSVSGIGVDSVMVACYNNTGETHQLFSSSSTSTVQFDNVSPNSTIMIYKDNYYPYIAPLLLQNAILSKSQYVIATDFSAGNTIDSSRATGDVVITNGVEYEIEASGTVTLNDGFMVEKGATFAVYPSSF